MLDHHGGKLPIKETTDSPFYFFREVALYIRSLYKNAQSSIAPKGMQYAEFVNIHANGSMIIIPDTSNISAGSIRNSTSQCNLNQSVLQRPNKSKSTIT